MNALRGLMDTIRTHLGRLSPSQKLLIASLVVIVAMGLFLSAQYAGKRKMVELLAVDGQANMVSVLRGADINAEVRDGKVWVPPSERRLALATLAQGGQLPDDTTILFDSLIDRQKWTNSREQNQQLYLIALQNELGRVVAGFRGVRTAKVILDVPEARGLGLVVREPTASATVFTQSGRPLSQDAVDAIAGLIAGARAGLDLRNIRVIDGTNGRQYAARSEDEAHASTYLEHAAAVEGQMRTKLARLLGYIPGVIVAVTAQVDVTRSTIQSTDYKTAEQGGTVSLLGSETIQSSKESSRSGSAEPGLRSNATADINMGGPSGGSSFETKQSEASMENHVGSRVVSTIDPKGMPTRLVASINIPRSYVVAVLTGGSDEAEDPTPEQIDEKFDEIRQSIEQSIAPHLQTETSGGAVTAGVVTVSLIPVETPAATQAQQAGMLGGGGGMLALGGGLVEKVVIGLLAVVSLGLMIATVRKSSKPQDLPTPEELVGQPPRLESGEDLIGEVDESDMAMPGVEIGEEDVHQSRMLEQLKGLIGQDPNAAARLLNQWIAPDD